MTDHVPSVRGGHELTPTGGTLAHILAELERAPLAANTRRGYRSALIDFEQWRDGRPLTKTTAEEYAAHLTERGLAPGTVNHRLAAVRWWARRVADLAAEADNLTPERQAALMARAERAATVKSIPGNSEMAGRHVPDGEVRALLQAALAQEGPAAVRDAAMIAVAFAAGLRRSELCGLDLADVTPIPATGPAQGYDLTARHAKGGKTRTVAIYNGARDYLRDWLAIRGDAPGPLWWRIRKGGEIMPARMSANGAYQRLRQLAEAAGIASIGYHDARRTLAGNLLDAGADLATVQRIMGHASPVTTSAYDRRPEEARRSALRRLHVPYLSHRGAG